MAAPVLTPALVSLRAAFDALAPSRRKLSDGWIGDTAHQQSVSDHNPDETGNVPIHDADHVNEVHAADIDAHLNESDLTMAKVVAFLVARCRSGAERRLRYIIHNRTIWEASNGWRARKYTGSSPHTEHAHFSGSYDSILEASATDWHLGEIPVALTQADKTWLSQTITSAANAAALKVLAETLGLNDKIGDKVSANRTVGDVLRDVAKLRGHLVGDVYDTKNAAIAAGSPLGRLVAAADYILADGAHNEANAG